MTTRPSKAALLSSTFTGLTSQYFGTLTQGLVQVGVLAVLARLLTPADFGLVGLATVFIGLAALLAQFGISTAVVRQPELTDRDVRAAYTLALLLGLGVTLVVAGAAAPLASAFRNPALADVLRALSLTFLLGNPSAVAEALLERRMEWGRVMWVNLAAFVFGYALTGCVLAVLDFGAWALVGSQLAQTALRTVLLLRASPHPKRFLLDGGEIRLLTRFGGSFTLARLFNYGAQQGDYLVVGRVLGVTPLGFYTRAFKLMQLPSTYFAAVIAKVLFPIMARVQGEVDRLRLAYLTGSAVITIVTAPLSALMIVTAPEIVEVVLGPRWQPTVAPFQVLAAGVVFRNAFVMAYILDGAVGDMGKRMVRDFLYAVAVLAGSVLGVRYGLVGVGAGVLAAILLNYVVAAAMSARLLATSGREYFRSQWPGIGFGVAAALIAIPVRLLLLHAGSPALALLAGTWLGTLALLIFAIVIRPRLVGSYGLVALRLGGTALLAQLPEGGFPRLVRLSRGLAQRMVASSAQPVGVDPDSGGR
jgi:PST family polysaccharide transporter